MNTPLRTGGVVALALAGALAPPAHAQIGGASVVFLQIEPDSRAAGMGNAGVANADNANAIFWNPAGLAGQTGTEIGLTHSNWLPEFNAGLFYEYAVAKHHVPKVGTFGAHLTYLFLGKHDATDEQGLPLGEFKSYDLSTGISYGTNVTKNLAVGTGVRVIYSSLAPLDDNSGTGTSVGVDLAALYSAPAFKVGSVDTRLKAGFNLANIGPAMEYSSGGFADSMTVGDGGDPIPTNLRFGWSATFDFDEFNQLRIANDFNKAIYRVEREELANGQTRRTIDGFPASLLSSWKPNLVDLDGDDTTPPEEVTALEQLTIGAGAEYWYNKLFALRGGYFYENPNNGNRKFLTFGAGIRYNIVGVDFSYIYALEENSPLANTMRFSLLVNFLR